jgi:hypothetical protein
MLFKLLRLLSHARIITMPKTLFDLEKLSATQYLNSTKNPP